MSINICQKCNSKYALLKTSENELYCLACFQEMAKENKELFQMKYETMKQIVDSLEGIKTIKTDQEKQEKERESLSPELEAVRKKLETLNNKREQAIKEENFEQAKNLYKEINNYKDEIKKLLHM